MAAILGCVLLSDSGMANAGCLRTARVFVATKSGSAAGSAPLARLGESGRRARVAGVSMIAAAGGVLGGAGRPGCPRAQRR
jgi:hypothetical protein